MRNLKIVSLVALMSLTHGTTSLFARDIFSKEQKESIEQTIEEFLMKKPEVMEAAFQKLQEKRQQQQASKNKQAISTNREKIFNTASDPFIGNPHGKKKLVVFMDPFCGHCRKFHKVLHTVSQDNDLKDLKVIFKDLPIFGDISKLAVRAIFAAKNQGKYDEFQNEMFEASPDIKEEDIMNVAQKLKLDMVQFKKDLTSKDIEKKITENETLAGRLGVDATPTIVYGDFIIPGGPDLDALKQIISLTEKEKGKV